MKLCVRQGKNAVNPTQEQSKGPETFDREMYKAPNLIENSLLPAQAVRASDTRYDKTARMSSLQIHWKLHSSGLSEDRP